LTAKEGGEHNNPRSDRNIRKIFEKLYQFNCQNSNSNSNGIKDINWGCDMNLVLR